MANIKKVVLVLLVLVVLTACGAKPDEQSSTTDLSGEGGQGEVESEGDRGLFRQDPAEGELPLATQLAVGLILLENTEYRVDQDQAEVLIPYWKLYLNLLENDATAAEELEAIVNEIQDVLTTDQASHITDLALVQEDLMALMSEFGLNAGLRQDGDGAGTGFSPPEGMEGTRPGGGEGRGQGSLEGMDPELMATMQARREEMGGAGVGGVNRMQIPIIEALIELLEGKLE